MKKILQCGLFTVLGSCCLEANASDIHHPEKGEPTSSLSVVPQSLSQSVEVSPDVATMLYCGVSIASAWGLFRNNMRAISLLPLLQDVDSIAPALLGYRGLVLMYAGPFSNLKIFFSDIQNLTEEQVLELVKGLKQEVSKIESTPYFCQRDILGKEMRVLAESVPSISLLSKLSEAYEILSTKDDSDKWARDILYKFAGAVKGQNHIDALSRLLAALPLIYSKEAEYMKKAPSLTALIRVVCGLCCSNHISEALLCDSRMTNGKRAFFAINRLGNFATEKCKRPNSLFDPCGVRFSEKTSWDDSDVMKIAKILAKEGITESVHIISTNGEFSIPLELTNQIQEVLLKDMTVSDKVLDFLLRLKGVNNFHITNVQGDKLIKFFQSSKCNIGSIVYDIINEDPNLLQCILGSKYSNSRKTLSVSPHFLIANEDAIEEITASIEERAENFDTIRLRLTGVKAEDLLQISRIWNTIETSKIKQKCLIISSDEWYRLHEAKDFKDLLFSFKEVEYSLRRGRSLDSLKEIIPNFSADLEGVTFVVEGEELTSEKTLVITNSVLEYCHNLGSIAWLSASCSVVPTICFPCHAILHPVWSRRCKDDKGGVLDLLNNFKPNTLLAWETVPDELAKYPLILEKLISNSRDFRTKCAQIYTELWKKNHNNPDLMPLNDKLAKYVAFLSNELLPLLAQKFNTIREVFYAPSPQRKKMEKTYREFLDWMKPFEAKLNADTDDILTSIRDLLAKESNASLIELLKSVEKSVKVQRSWWLKLRQEVCSSFMLQIIKHSENELYEVIGRYRNSSQEPDHKRVKEDK